MQAIKQREYTAAAFQPDSSPFKKFDFDNPDNNCMGEAP
jgi:hypothetical protein